MCAGKGPDDCGDPNKPDDPFTTMPAKGEPARMAFATPKFTIGVVIVPDPIEANDRGCTLSAVRRTPRFELAFVSGSGIPQTAKSTTGYPVTKLPTPSASPTSLEPFVLA
jgi:hypothetical protein